MNNKLLRSLLALLLGAALAGCGDTTKDSTATDSDNQLTEDESDDSGDGNADSAADDTASENVEENEDDDETSDGNGDDDSDDADDADSAEVEICEELTTDLSRVPTKVMILEDKSLSMDDNNKWTLALEAINGMATAYDNDIQFGLDLFARASDTSDNNTGRPDRNNNNASCAVGESVIHDVALGNADLIVDALSNASPSDATPLLLAMRNYTDPAYAPLFLGGDGNRYLVVLSDGQDTCGTDGVFSMQGGATAAELAAVTAQLAENGIKTIVIGFGQGVDPDQLNAIAAAGGTSFTEYLQASDGEELKAALSTIAEKVVVSCEFEMGTFDSSDVNMNLVMVSFDGTQVPRDDNCAGETGWTWKDDSQTVIQFCTYACGILESEAVEEIQVKLACSEDDIIQVE
ncbi:MAG: VWA domain-containing protein [Deltaproteobacteria bacterium]|nr:VWA domain-containing protein [Deltaproteobacteria bacterium]